ncbi:MAG: hypothetical protein ABL886_14710, partial [Rhodoglobus sp.]
MPRAFVLVDDARAREALEDALNATGYTIETGEPGEADDALVALGTASLTTTITATLAREGPRPGLMIVAEDTDRARALGLFVAHRAGYLVDPFATPLVSTLRKRARQDYFGLGHYLREGAAERVFEVATSEERRAVLDEVSEAATRERCHPRQVELLGSALDEMIINALYRPDPNLLVGDRAERPATVTFACDGRFFGVAVRDSHGRFARNDLFDSLDRASDHARSGIATTTTHASLGLRTMLDGLAQLAINVEAGARTE